jgi:hypothetical protein
MITTIKYNLFIYVCEEINWKNIRIIYIYVYVYVFQTLFLHLSSLLIQNSVKFEMFFSTEIKNIIKKILFQNMFNNQGE